MTLMGKWYHGMLTTHNTGANESEKWKFTSWLVLTLSFSWSKSLRKSRRAMINIHNIKIGLAQWEYD